MHKDPHALHSAAPLGRHHGFGVLRLCPNDLKGAPSLVFERGSHDPTPQPLFCFPRSSSICVRALGVGASAPTFSNTTHRALAPGELISLRNTEAP
jgi:hypothetical protein